MLAADLQLPYEQPSAAWYARVDSQGELDEWPSSYIGPRQFERNDWIVRLSKEATQSLNSFDRATSLLDQESIRFQIVAGLGLPGLLHVRSLSLSSLDVETSFASNSRVAYFSANNQVEGQVLPNDSSFGSMTNLNNMSQFGGTQDADIDAPEAWDFTVGSPSVVVGVIDSGIDAAHPDLYRNIWLNQGEIPTAKQQAIEDTDSDGLITFYDLNNSQNKAQVRDLNVNGYIDAIDLLDDPLWADGRDTDGNGFTDDFFGWNFRTNSNETFAPNNPTDVLGHGTHVAGTIGAMGNNGDGVTGINWRSSIMALKFLDENNQGDTASAIAAINYATMMRTQFGTNVRVLNNSWGQPGGSNVALRNAIQDSGDAGILFVAAAGNGNILGQGVDNDRIPFYPASYDLANVLSVAASDANNSLASFSNYGLNSVDLAAPGVGVISTLPGGKYGSANGTSMAAPHVSGAAILVWSKYPSASLKEVRDAILQSVKPAIGFSSSVAAGGVLSAKLAIVNGIYSPTVSMEPISDITKELTNPQQIKVRYSHGNGIDMSTIDDHDLVIERQWGDRSTLSVRLRDAQQNPGDGSVVATYEIQGTDYQVRNSFSSTVPVVIPSDAATTITSSITVDGVNDTVSALQVKLNILHTWDSDLHATLVSPAGTQVKLFENIGGNEDDFQETVFDDRSETSIRNERAPFTGTFRPFQPLQTFAGESINGTWKLIVEDEFPLDGGSLDNWTLSFADKVWSPKVMDYGRYTVSSVANQVSSQIHNGNAGVPIQVRQLGAFNVKIDDPAFIYVTTYQDGDTGKSLRQAINEANAAAPSMRTIILDSGVYALEKAVSPLAAGQFVTPDPNAYCNDTSISNVWSDAATGDLDIKGDITIIGDSYLGTSIDAQSLDRVFKVHKNAKLNLRRVKIENGNAAAGQGGGGILSAGSLSIVESIVADNRALGSADSPIRGGGIAVWDGDVLIQHSQITGNIANYGGGVFVCGSARVTIDSSTIDNNFGTGFTSYSTTSPNISNSTFSENQNGAIYSGSRDGFSGGRGTAGNSSVSSDGRFVTFESDAGNLLAGDTKYRTHVMLLDRLQNRIERISSNLAGSPADSSSTHPSISGDGVQVVFHSAAQDLTSNEQDFEQDVFVKNRQSGVVERISKRQPNDNVGQSFEPVISNSGRFVAYSSTVPYQTNAPDTNGKSDVFIYDLESKTTERILKTVSGQSVEPNNDSGSPALSADGRFVAFISRATNLTAIDTANQANVYVFDRNTGVIELISRTSNGVAANQDSQLPSISGDGRFVAFQSDASNLVLNDTNSVRDVFVFDRVTQSLDRVSVNQNQEQGNSDSQFPSISLDGNTIAFSSYANNLFPNDFNFTSDVFLANRISGQLKVVAGGNFNGTADIPAITANGTEVFFQFDGNNYFDDSSPLADRNDFQDLVAYNVVNDQRSAISYFPSSRAYVSNSTFVGNRSTSTVSGNIDVVNSLFAGNAVGFDLGMESRSRGYNLMSTKPELGEGFPGSGIGQAGKDIIDNRGIDFIEDLSSELGFPPVHVQRFGSKGIDAGDPAYESSKDQLGFNRINPDIGAVESRLANIEGTVYIDRNLNGKRDDGELGYPSATVYFDSNRNNSQESDEPTTKSKTDEPGTQVDETGDFSLRSLTPGNDRFRVAIPADWFASQPPLTRIVDGSIQGDVGTSSEVSLDRTGRYLTFSSISAFGFADNFRQEDVFIYDRETATLDRITNDAPSFQPTISQNGRYVVFASISDRLASLQDVNTNNNIADIFLYDRNLRTTVQVTHAFGGREANGLLSATNGESLRPSVSEDGRFVVFESSASNLVPNDNNGVSDVFLWDRNFDRIQRISDWYYGEGNGRSANPLISADGSIISFSSFADNLVAPATSEVGADEDFQDLNQSEDVFVYYRDFDIMDSPSLKRGNRDQLRSFSPVLSADGTTLAFTSNSYLLARDDFQTDFDILFYDITSYSLTSFDDSARRYTRVNIKDASGQRIADLGDWGRSISEDGQYLVFNSGRSDFLSGDNNSKSDIYVYDRVTENVRLISHSDSGLIGNDDSFLAAISGNGQFLGFSSNSSNLVLDDSNRSLDIFTVRNPFELATIEVNLRKGEYKSGIDFGLVPNFGTIRGNVFLDSIENGSYDLGESKLDGWVVYLDQNNNGIRDTQDTVAVSTKDGFSFEGVPSYQQYNVRFEPRDGWALTTNGDDNTIAVFLQAGGEISGVDFGFRQVAIGGQSLSSSITGQLYQDANEDGIHQPNEAPIAGATVYLDLDGNESRGFNEPQAVTDGSGRYDFTGLGGRTYTVRTLQMEGTIQTTPRGSKFTTTTYKLTSGSSQLANPQDVVAEDFNGDGWPDLAVALFSGNSIAIRLNDRAGGFGSQSISVSVAPDGAGPGPIALASGSLNSGTAVDMISANYLNGTATILRDFNGTGFDTNQTLPVGASPTDVVLGKFDGDSDLDAIVANQSTDQLTLLVNDGNGGFTKGASFSSGGRKPAALVTGLFNSDSFMDIAVANYGTNPTGSDLGNVAVLLGRGDGTFQPAIPYIVGSGPISIAAEDFNGDGFVDLVTANFLSDGASMLLGTASGIFTVASEPLTTGQGPLEVTLQDIDNDRDKDILVTNRKSQSISILRNRKSEGIVGFEPAENVGLSRDSSTPHLAFAVADFDNDKKDTVDIVVVNNQGDSLKVMRNTLVNGGYRIGLTGFDAAENVDFGIWQDVLVPRMDPIANPESLVEDAPQQSVKLTGIAAGRTGGPALRIIPSSSNALVISNLDVNYVAGATTGDLVFTPAKDANGQVTITVEVRDAGADKLFNTLDDGVLKRDFTVSIKPVNDAPTFGFPTSRSINVLEDSGAKTVSGFVSNITAGGGSFESMQTLEGLFVAADNLGLFSSQPIIDANGTLRFTPAPDAVGTATITVTLRDDGDTDFGGTNLKTDQFVLTINPVNDAPSINIGGKQTVLVGAAPQIVSSFATGFAPGGGVDESSQVLAGFVIVVDKPDLFSVSPAIDSAGTLRYVPSTTRTGITKVTVQARDDGGANNGGVDLSTLKTFDVEVTPLPDTTSPTPILSSTTSTITNASSIDLTIDFGEAVTGFVLNDLQLVNATASNFVDLGAGKFTVAVSAILDGAINISVPAASASDLANNASLASAKFTRTVDRFAPVATITTAEPNPTNRNTFPIVINFGEAVQGFELADLVVGNASASDLTEVNPGRYSVTLTVVQDGVVFVGFSAGIARDPAGNLNSAPAPLLISVNSGALTFKPLIITSEPLVTGNREISATIDFGRVVTGFEAADLTLTNATGSVTDLGAGKYQLNLQAIGEGLLTVELPTNKVLDLQGRPNASADPMSLTYVDVTNSDFGDAPSSAQSGLSFSYPTSLTNNAARHKTSSLYLGSRVDVESNGLLSPDALGDDQAGSIDDEDGVRFPISLIVSPTAATSSSILVVASQAAKLDGWIDFNRDGDWFDAGEQIFTSVAVTAGSNLLAFVLPAGASSGSSFARFRVSTAGGLSAGGPALDGEVEDYRVDLLASSSDTLLKIRSGELGDHEVTIRAGQLVVQRATQVVFSASATAIGSLQIVDSSGSVATELKQPQTNLSGSLKWGGDRSTWIVSSPAIGLSSLVPSVVVGVHTLDLSSAIEQVVQLQLATIQAINSAKNLRIDLGAKDTLRTDSNWKYAAVAVEGNQFVPRFTQADASLDIRSQAPWQNPLNRFDVSGDATVSALDALLVINELNNRVLTTGGVFKPPSAVPSSAFRFLDTDGSGLASPVDVLLIINFLNQRSNGEGELQEFFDDSATLNTQSTSASDLAIAQLVHEEELQKKKRGRT